MRMNLAVDPDDDPEGLLQQVLPWVQIFGGTLGLRAALHVVFPGDPFTGIQVLGVAELRAELNQSWMRRLTDLQRFIPEAVRGDVKVLTGPEHLALSQDAPSCELLVLGSHQRGAVDRLVAGSVSERVLHSVSCPTLILPLACAPPSPDPLRVVVPVDVEDGDLRALRWLRHHLPEAQLHAAYVRARLPWLEARLIESVPASELDRLSEIELRATLDGAGFSEVEAVSISSNGAHTGDTLCRFADAIDADLIAMPTHSRGGLARLVFGSVTQRVMRQASRAVLVLQ